MNQDLVFFRLHPSRFDAKSAEAVSISAIRTDSKGKVLAAFASRVQPEGDVSPEATTLSSYNPIEWAEEPKFKEAAGMLRSNVLSPFGARYIVIAHQADFDRVVLRRQWQEVTKVEGELFDGRVWIDTAQLCYPFAVHGLMTGRSLDAMASHFGVTIEMPRSAGGDCTALMASYGAMMKRYKFALHGEDAIRDLGGETLASFRKMVGL